MLLLLGALLVLADLAPVMASAQSPRFQAAAVGASLALSPTCHQRPERALTLGGLRLNSCARCTGLHVGGLLAGLALLSGLRVRRDVGILLVLTSLGAMALDVAAGLLWAQWDHAVLRLVTGMSVALAVGCAAVGELESPLMHDEPVASAPSAA